MRGSSETRRELRVSGKAGGQVDGGAEHSWYVSSGEEVSPAL